MRKTQIFLSLSLGLGMSCLGSAALAKATEAELAKLGNELTCVGAEAGANADGTIPAFSGKWTGTPPGIDYPMHVGAHPVDPYPDDKPLYEVTAANMAEHESKLSDGQKEMFRRYPNTYRIVVYPGRRDFGYSESLCAVARKNAEEAELTDGGLGFTGYQGMSPFPFPKEPMELLHNTIFPMVAWTEDVVRDVANVRPSGDIFWGRQHNRNLNVVTDPEQIGKPMGEVMAYALTDTLLPVRDRGSVSVAQEPVNFARSKRLAWSYDPGTRRVRQLPQFGYDSPLAGTSGQMTMDQDRLMNGDPARYEWKMLGKRELLIPANTYRMHRKMSSYDGLLTPNHANPDEIRYELRRVWVLEGSLKDGFRHAFGRRVMYLDEDNWQASVSDYYDTRGELWQHAFIAHYYAFDMGGWQAGTSFYHDLNSGGYVAYNLFQGLDKGPTINAGKMSANMFTPDALRQIGN